jgi:hypothetical protein
MQKKEKGELKQIRETQESKTKEGNEGRKRKGELEIEKKELRKWNERRK